MNKESWLDEINWTEDGLVPAIAQDARDGRILMLAWMNREALQLTASTKKAESAAELRPEKTVPDFASFREPFQSGLAA